MPLRTRFGQFFKKLLRIGKSNDHFFGGRRPRTENAARGEFEAQSRYWNGF